MITNRQKQATDEPAPIPGKRTRTLNWKYIAIGSLPIQAILFTVFAQHQDWIEDIYIPHVFGNITLFLRTITAGIPFSIGIGLFYLSVLIGLFRLTRSVVRLARKQLSTRYFLINMTTAIAVLYGIYMILWGLAYYRRPFTQLTHINTSAISTEELKTLCNRLIYLTNLYRRDISDQEARSFESDKLFRQAPVGYAVVSKNIPQLRYESPSIKLGFSKEIMSYLSTAGIYFPFTGEANVNGNLPTYRMPFTICHEMAHQLGFASEEEANFIAYLTCMNNPDPIFRYSANHEAMYYALHALRQADQKAYKQLKSTIDDAVVQDAEFYWAIMDQYNNPLQDFISNVLYDLFLKVNNQESGIKSYGLVVELLVGEMRKNNLTYR